MSGRSVTGLPFFAFTALCGMSFAGACSSDATNYFDTPYPSAGKSAAGTGGAGTGDTDGGGTGGSTAGSGTPSGGSGGDQPTKGGSGGSDAKGGSSNPTGGTPSVGGSGGDTPSQGGTGHGGTTTDGGVGGENGAGETGTGGTAGTGGTGGTQPLGGEGGMAGEPVGGGGTGGTGAGTGGTGGQPSTCGADDECASTEYCKKTKCDAAMGVCTARTASCTGDDATVDPVCGCDHMTYYTACVAAHEGINVAATGACKAGAITCNRTDGGSSCIPARARAACYRTRSTNSCSSGMAPNDGVCWVLPETCPTETTTELDCNMGDTPVCRGLCDALEKNRPLIRNSTQCD